MIRRLRLQYLAPQDREAWQKQYYGHQKHWQRRPPAISPQSDLGRTELGGEVCRRQTLPHWLDSYLHGGFDVLLTRASPRAQLLSVQRQRILRLSCSIKRQPIMT